MTYEKNRRWSRGGFPFSKPPPSASRPPHRTGILSINDVAGYAKAIVRVIVPEIVPCQRSESASDCRQKCPDQRLEMGNGFFLNQTFRQTPALQAFARLSWRPDPVNHGRLAPRRRPFRPGGWCRGAQRSSEPLHDPAPFKRSVSFRAFERQCERPHPSASILALHLCRGARRSRGEVRRSCTPFPTHHRSARGNAAWNPRSCRLR